MLENHSHPMLRNRQIAVKQSPPSIIPVPVGEQSVSCSLPPVPVEQEPLPPQHVIPPALKPLSEKQRATTIKKQIAEPHVKNSDLRNLVTCIIVNFKTKRLTKQALTTLLGVYPTVSVVLIDNGSHDGSTSLVRQAGKVYPGVTSVMHKTNIGHGPAMHKAIVNVKTEYVFTLDSDCIVNKTGFLERMLRTAIDDNLYAIGWQRWVDKRSGVSLEWHAHGIPDRGKFVAYIHPCAGLYNVLMYKQLPPFTHHGAPCVTNMTFAAKRGFKVRAFPVFNYIKHLKAGTRRMYQGRWDPRTNDKPGPWNEDKDWPI